MNDRGGGRRELEGRKIKCTGTLSLTFVLMV